MMLLVDSTFTSRGYGGIAEDNRTIVQNITKQIETVLLFDKGAEKESQNHIVLKQSLQSINKLALLKRGTVKAVAWNDNSYQTHITGLRSLSKTGTTFLRIHDIFPLTNPGWFTLAGQRIFHLGAKNIKPGTVLICNSDTTKLTVSRHHFFSHLESIVLPCQVKREVINVFSCGLCWVCVNPPIAETYVLAVGTIEPRKNYPILLEAWKLAKRQTSFDRLVIAGKMGWKSRHLVSSLSKSDEVSWFTPCEGGLQSLYKNASGFLSASLAEGFDIPSMQASDFGLPLALSDIPVHKELLPNAQIFFNPTSISSVSQALKSLIPGIPSSVASHVQRNYDSKFREFFNQISENLKQY
jgi:glycosyltransferase involved in cell wall biosynthesis